jgi:hypothetical protein
MATVKDDQQLPVPGQRPCMRCRRPMVPKNRRRDCYCDRRRKKAGRGVPEVAVSDRMAKRRRRRTHAMRTSTFLATGLIYLLSPLLSVGFSSIGSRRRSQRPPSGARPNRRTCYLVVLGQMARRASGTPAREALGCPFAAVIARIPLPSHPLARILRRRWRANSNSGSVKKGPNEWMMHRSCKSLVV